VAVTKPVLRSLRDATLDAHVRIHHHPFLSGLTRPGFSIWRYKRLLGAFFGIYEAIEREVDVFVQAHTIDLQYDSRRKLSWLRAVLQYLNVGRSALSRCGTLPRVKAPIPDVGALIGTLYAIEGATPGGQIISRHLHCHLGLSASAGVRLQID
jgi:heme oxygenase